MKSDEFELHKPFPDLFPKEWSDRMGPRDFMAFRNLEHFKHYVSQLTQREDNKCGMSYGKALSMLNRGETDFPVEEQESIRNLVRSNLHKRGLITEEVYENFRYATDGTQIDVDVGKYAAGEPDCMMVPSRQYIDYFYELYISVSYPWQIENTAIRKNVAKLLAAIEELERKHIHIKIVLIWADEGLTSSRDGKPGKNFFAAIPLYSHKTPKSVATMSSVVNDRLLRKFLFAVIEDLYGNELLGHYGHPVSLDGTMNIGEPFDEIKFFESVVEKVGSN